MTADVEPNMSGGMEQINVQAQVQRYQSARIILFVAEQLQLLEADLSGNRHN